MQRLILLCLRSLYNVPRELLRNINPRCLASSLAEEEFRLRKRDFQGRSDCGNYGAFMEETDFRVGQVLDALKANGLEENTLVIFSSDIPAAKLSFFMNLDMTIICLYFLVAIFISCHVL